MNQPSFAGVRWALAIFSARETPDELMDVVVAAANSTREGATLEIDVLINGNRPLAAEMKNRLAAGPWLTGGVAVRLWSMPGADKARAWNHALHALLPDTDVVFFMDGYVRAAPTAFLRIAEALRERPQALAASSLPSTGPSAPTMRRRLAAEGGLHGNLYALTRAAVHRLRAEGFALPAGLYRNDSALGAAIAFNLDPARHPWNWDRIALVPDADYETPVPNPARLRDLRALLNRRMRQAQGALETLALKAHLAQAKRPPSAWPSTTRGLVLGWADAHPSEALQLLWTDPLAWYALQTLRRSTPPPTEVGAVECLGRYARVTAVERAPLAVSAR
jgi:hypothetical protein